MSGELDTMGDMDRLLMLAKRRFEREQEKRVIRESRSNRRVRKRRGGGEGDGEGAAGEDARRVGGSMGLALMAKVDEGEPGSAGGEKYGEGRDRSWSQ